MPQSSSHPPSPPHLPCFESFVEGTKYSSLNPDNLPDRCPQCMDLLELPAYELVDLHRHEAASLPASSWEKSCSFSSSYSSSSTTASESDDHVMEDDTSSSSLSPIAVDQQQEQAREKRHGSSSAAVHKAHKKHNHSLTDQQRYEIVCHVLSGETQSHVAKEYGVTRAAVSYLVKHHNEIMHRVLTLHASCCHQRTSSSSTTTGTHSSSITSTTTTAALAS